MLPMIKNASVLTETFVARPESGDVTQDKSLVGVNAHLRIEGWRD